ncbi:uncharacterized protein EV422DRAFT_386641 [Fimicolochytrium jonesii]|uniref:uncharacterized protein n=1 Tax=Fimicolochytrium jonesii TaxID=1396493 RepID=UPI0022FE8249|nr:uncharacterized protein EV422DRAFT_386641 [Fimicolochytrium jonesii]KAI8822970.1 hypothetical protein EV422DRAFT_386641 [Fimicolochytrium jonesii]
MEFLSPAAPAPFSPLGVGAPPGFQLHSLSPFVCPAPNPPALVKAVVPDSPPSPEQHAQAVDIPAPTVVSADHTVIRPSVRSKVANRPYGQPRKNVTFREFVTVAPTWSGDEYDRTSTDVEPLTKRDLIELLLFRAEMQNYTRELVRIRKQAIDAERRFQRQQEIAALQAYQRCTIAAAAQYAAHPTLGWGGGMAIAAAGGTPMYTPYQHQNDQALYFNDKIQAYRSATPGYPSHGRSDYGMDNIVYY